MKSYMRTKTQDALLEAAEASSISAPNCDLLAIHALSLVQEDRDRANRRTEFDGAFYNPATDDHRLKKQMGRVFNAMSDGQWHTLNWLVLKTGDPHASISAQIRHLRKPRHGSWIVKTDAWDGSRPGTFYYQLRNPNGTLLETAANG